MEANPLNARCPTTAGHAFYCGCGERVVTPMNDLPDKVNCPNCGVSRRIYTCGWCGEAGHNRRRCILLERQKVLRLDIGRALVPALNAGAAFAALSRCDRLFAGASAVYPYATPAREVRAHLQVAGFRLSRHVADLTELQTDLDFYLCGGNLSESNDHHATEARY